VHDHREREAHHCRGGRAAENHDDGVLVVITGEVAAIDQDQDDDRGDAAEQADTRCDIHRRLFWTQDRAGGAQGVPCETVRGGAEDEVNLFHPAAARTSCLPATEGIERKFVLAVIRLGR
jgi:hypothetical protein